MIEVDLVVLILIDFKLYFMKKFYPVNTFKFNELFILKLIFQVYIIYIYILTSMRHLFETVIFRILNGYKHTDR